MAGDETAGVAHGQDHGAGDDPTGVRAGGVGVVLGGVLRDDHLSTAGVVGHQYDDHFAHRVAPRREL